MYGNTNGGLATDANQAALAARHEETMAQLSRTVSQAEDLLRDATNEEPQALARVYAVSDRLILASAQLAIAREYGFESGPNSSARSSAARSSTAAIWTDSLYFARRRPSVGRQPHGQRDRPQARRQPPHLHRDDRL